MNDPITAIGLALIDNYTRIIKSLARKGRKSYEEYLVRPLSSWSGNIPIETLDRLLDLLKEAESRNEKKLPVLYKMILVKSTAHDQLDLSVTGNISIEFMKSMKFSEYVAHSGEALEFVNLLRGPFKKFNEIEFKLLNRKFEDEIKEAEPVRVEQLIKIREGQVRDNLKTEDLARDALHEIERISGMNDITALKNAIISFLLKFSDSAAPDRHTAVYDVMKKVKSDGNFIKDVMDSAAVIIYHEILKSIKDKDLNRAVKFISKYAVLFRGNPGTPNFNEVDSFEKKFFQIIDQRNLWESI